MTGAKYTLAVNKAAADGGVKDFADIAQHKDKFDNKIYGIEPGNDGNRLIQGMLAQVKRAKRKKEWVVFLGWEPHPMNANFKLTCLTGGDAVFGPNLGGAEIFTNVRKGYVAHMNPLNVMTAGSLLTSLADLEPADKWLLA